MGGNESEKNFEYLRQKAEELLADKSTHPPELSMEINEIIHELEVHQIELELQNEELKRAQIGLEDSRRDYYELYDFAPVGYITLDEKGIISRINLTGAEILGKPRKYLLKQPLIRFIVPSYKKTFLNHLQEVKKNHINHKCSVELITREGITFFVSLDTTAFFNEEDDFKGFRTILVNINESKKMEMEMEKSLKEKELLLKEIHHRVKNNLQVISSLLNLQSEYIKDKTDQELFRESQTRAKSMALIHERLYQSDDLRRIDFAEYTESLVHDLYRTYGANSKLRLNMDLEPVMVDINTAIPCGLVVNELVSNVMKHAFPKGVGGDLNIRFYSQDKNLILIVQDNGIGFPKDIDFRNTKSLGLKLVNTLINQIDGEIGLILDNGTEFKITFPETKFDDE